jgi:hypothetical protein
VAAGRRKAVCAGAARADSPVIATTDVPVRQEPIMTTLTARTVAFLLSAVVTAVTFGGANGIAARVYDKVDAAQPILVAPAMPDAVRYA